MRDWTGKQPNRFRSKQSHTKKSHVFDNQTKLLFSQNTTNTDKENLTFDIIDFEKT
jgi:hypothetical protein